MSISRWIRANGRLSTAIAAGAMAASLFAACGSDDSTETARAEGAAAELSGPPLRVAALVEGSGPGAGNQDATAPVMEAWAEDVNADGGVLGHPVEVVVRDTKGDTPTATRQVQELIADESTVAVVVQAASNDAAIGKLLSESGLPVIGGMGFGPPWHALPNWFGITTSQPALTEMGVLAGVEKGLDRQVAASCAEAPGCAEFRQAFEQLVRKNGAKFLGQIPVSLSQPNYTAECLEFIDAGADYIFVVSAPAEVVRLASDCTRQGFDSFFGASGGGVDPEVLEGIDRLTGGLNAFPWFVDAEPVRRYRDVMEKADVAEEDWATTHGTATWATMELFRTALENSANRMSDQPTRAEVLAAYGRVRDETLGGLLPQPTSFRLGKPAPPVNCFWLYTAEDGQPEADFAPTCADPAGAEGSD